MAVLIVRGDPAAFRACFALMLVATLIDATDGFLARAARVKEVLPGFDGRELDYLTDFLTYVVLPLLLVWRAAILPAGWEAWLIAPLLAGAYWFCQVQAKTDDGYFLGFPAYWNIVAFYLYVAHRQIGPLPGWLSLAVLLVFTVLTFVPTRYLYSTNGGRLNLVTNVLASVWVVLVVWIVYRLPSGNGPVPGGDPWGPRVVGLSLLFPVYYLVVSWYLSCALAHAASRREGLTPVGGNKISYQSVVAGRTTDMNQSGRRYRSSDEPVPGYRLTDFKEAGPSGMESWEATGPDGREVTVTIIPVHQEVTQEVLEWFNRVPRFKRHHAPAAASAFGSVAQDRRRPRPGRALARRLGDVGGLRSGARETAARGGHRDRLVEHAFPNGSRAAAGVPSANPERPPLARADAISGARRPSPRLPPPARA